MQPNQTYPTVDPTPDVPRGVVNWPRQRQVLEDYARQNGIFSDERGYLSGAIMQALQYLDMFAKDNADYQAVNDALRDELDRLPRV